MGRWMHALSSFQSCLFSFSFPFCRLFATCPFALVSPGLALPRLACCARMSNLSWLALPRLASSSPLVPWKSTNLNNYWKSIEIMKATTPPLAVVTESCWATDQKQKGPTLRNAIDTRLPNSRHHPIMKWSRKKERKLFWPCRRLHWTSNPPPSASRRWIRFRHHCTAPVN